MEDLFEPVVRIEQLRDLQAKYAQEAREKRQTHRENPITSLEPIASVLDQSSAAVDQKGTNCGNINEKCRTDGRIDVRTDVRTTPKKYPSDYGGR
ncbi:hypothetical protein DPMN_178264 [Dreissena polymorpha]|uniref:Uncharacterized protein n=1 Tax=Dreissena polymorpha TaxID=45954 RepID=A0A9D4EDT9_DREPO|nr:hypothetical protein DPMN_178264 [Dreissena polymorpha]